jgi:hypothetical protein
MKLECGICRLPFNVENLKNDPITAELLTENQEYVLSQNFQINNISDSSRESEDNNSNYNTQTESRFHNPNEEIIRGESSYRIKGPYIIIKFYPNEWSCILSLLLNIIPGGLGTMLSGIIRKSKKSIVFGIIQFLLIDGLSTIGYLLFKKKELFKNDYNKILPIFLFIVSGFFYLISLYNGIIDNFVFINTKKVRKFHAKEVGIFILILNLIIPGFGTLMIQSIIPDKCILKMKRTLNGICQLTMFLILLLFFTGIEKMNDNFLLFVFLAIVEYLYTVGISVCFLRNILISDHIIHEIEDNN